MTWKTVDNSDAGTDDVFGGNDLDKVSDLFSGVDVDDVDINADFTVRSGKRKLRNPANTFSYIETASAIAADRTITEPALTANDVRVYENHLQQINSKTAGNWLKFAKQSTAPANQVIIDDFMVYNKQVDANNNGLYAKYKQAGAIVETAIVGGTALTATSTTTLTNKTIDLTTNSIADRAFTYKLFRSGTTYYAIRFDGALTTSGTDFEVVLQALCDLGGTIKIVGGAAYALEGQVNITKNDTNLLFDEDATVTVPDGYTGIGIRIIGTTGNIQNCSIRGLHISELGTPDKLWTAIKFEGGSGLLFCGVYDTKITNAGTGILLEALTSLTYVNGCRFDNVYFLTCKIGVDFNSGDPTGSRGIHRNTFIDVAYQDDNAVHSGTYGFKNVNGISNVFINCKSWDMNVPATQKTMTIHADAIHTQLIGGALARDGGFFIDDSRTTRNYGDDWDQSFKVGNITMTPSSFLPLGSRKRGWFDGAANLGGSGIFAGVLTAIANQPADASIVTYADGSVCNRRTTSTTVPQGAGFRYNRVFTCRGWNPIFRIKFRVNTPTLMRAYMGFTSALADPNGGDDPLTGLSGIMLCSRSADTLWQIAHNEGSGGTNFTATAQTKNTGIHTFELAADDSATNKWKYSWDGAAYIDITSADVPAQGTGLTFWCAIHTNEAVAKSIDIFAIDVETD